jgi:choline dehydrogenase-like flavoprotein
MNITVIGAGAIGGHIAAKLAAAGESVSVVARGEHLKAIRERGLILKEDGEEIVARVEATDRIVDVRHPDLVALGVKAHQLAPIAADVASILGSETMVLTTQNGIPWWYFFKHGGPYEGHRLADLVAARRRPCFGVYRRARSVNRVTAWCSALRPLRGDFHCARRSARGQVGTKGWSSRSNQGMGPRSGSGDLGGMFRVEGGLGFKHGASDSEEPIGDAAQGATMAMTALAQFRVAGAAARIVLDGDTGPMIDGGAQPQMAGLTHEDDAALAAASCHRSDAGQRAQRMIISFAQRFRGLAEQRGEDDPSDARQGSQDRHVALLGFLPWRTFLSAFSELVGEFVQPSMRLLCLLVHQFEARRHGGDVGGRWFVESHRRERRGSA